MHLTLIQATVKVQLQGQKKNCINYLYDAGSPKFKFSLSLIEWNSKIKIIRTQVLTTECKECLDSWVGLTWIMAWPPSLPASGLIDGKLAELAG